MFIIRDGRTVDNTRGSEILVENRDFSHPLAFDASLGCPGRNIAITFSVEKLEWCGYAMEKNFRRHVYSVISREYTNVTDGQTDRHHTTAGRAYA